MTDIESIHAAANSGRLLPAAAENIASFLAADLPAWAGASIHELVGREAWPELNDRFYRYLEFGTGGMRGRTIGAGHRPAAEAGDSRRRTGTPEHAAVGSNMLNDFTLARAVDRALPLHRKDTLAPAGAADAAAGDRLRRAASSPGISASWRRRSGLSWAARRSSSTGRGRPRSSATACAGSRPTPASSSPRATIRPTTTDSRPTSTTGRRSCRPTTRASSAK